MTKYLRYNLSVCGSETVSTVSEPQTNLLLNKYVVSYKLFN